MPRPCSICQHPNRGDVDAALVAGASGAMTAQQFAVSPDAVKRHRAHIPASLVQATHAVEVVKADDLMGKIQQYEAKAAKLGEAAEKSGDYRTALQAVRELVRIVELLAKLRGELGDGSTTVQIGVISNSDWIATRTAILHALEPFAEARAAVSLALAARGGT